jgi:hypothetical protein
MSEPIIIDNFIPEVYQDSLLTMLTGVEFPWNFHPYSVSGFPITDYYTDVPTKEHIQFRHIFVDNNVMKSPFLKFLEPLMVCFQHHTGMKIKSTQRIKTNLLMKQDGPHLQVPHIDDTDFITSQPNRVGKKTLLYYVSGGDGDTVLYNEHYDGKEIGLITRQQTVSPLKGRAVIFDSHQIHSGCCPAVSDYRIVINCVFEGV